MAFLEVKTPRGITKVQLSRTPVTVGRLSENAINFNDDGLSRRQCVVEPDPTGGWQVRDLQSRNGTKLNGQKVFVGHLSNGDTIRIGPVAIRYINPEEVAANPVGIGALSPQAARRARESAAEAQDLSTIDADSRVMNVTAEESQTGYERTLMRIIESAPEKPFGEEDIGLVDCRGVTVHHATASGVTRKKGKGGGDESAESIRLFRLLLLACFRARATDLHVEPRQENAIIRLRVDGLMMPAAEVSGDLARRVLGVVKILCQIDTSLKVAVQDGHFSAMAAGKRVDYRVSLTPAVNGQKLVVRVLDSGNSPTRMHELGLLPWQYEKLRAMSVRDAGLMLATGPTGSGKTTTIYSCLREIDLDTRNGVTIEDPVEYYLEGCTQIPIDAKQGHGFGQILRSVLRQDPDVIFVGEIRDAETATVATQASMTGHLVFSTVHARDTIGAIFRLLDLGVESYLVANALGMTIAQRLIRLLCPACRKGIRPTSAQTLKMGRQISGIPEIYIPQGCSACLGSGYHGRRALFELMEITDRVRDVILRKPTISDIKQALEGDHFVSLQGFGIQLVAQGITSMDEVDRVASGDS
ncbi:MAG: ATPase, T2SS/T4P/T4SS family [Planctomycetota bacterium]|nr:ATPase, T2SS/T4P/T4SS family [Planctomycetota bacterium]